MIATPTPKAAKQKREKPSRAMSKIGAVDKAAVLAFIAKYPARATKRDIAKAFGLKNEHRNALKSLLLELEADGALNRQGKKLTRPDILPSVSVLVITGRDDDGGLLAEPLVVPEGQDAPTIQIKTSSAPKTRTPGIGDRVLARIITPDEEGGTLSAKIMKVLDAERARTLGVIRTVGKTGERRIAPIDRKQAEYRIHDGDLAKAKDGDLVEVEAVKSSKTGRLGLPLGKIMNVIGTVASEKAVSMIAIHDHGLPYIFPDDVLAEAAEADIQPYAKREDWRDVPFVTIDPADAKDHDDAVFAKPDPHPDNLGGYIVDVAIADVAAYIMPNGAMDLEAEKRGNSVYFPDRVIPMLPERISNDLCSLRENEDRPALNMRMIFSSDGQKKSHSLHRITMRSVRRLSYQEAQHAFDDEAGPRSKDIAGTVLKPLLAAYKIALKGREKRQPLDLDLPERKLEIDEMGRVAGIYIPPRLTAHRLIEEFMIQANVCAAETLERRKLHLIYRVHEPPPLAKQEMLRDFLKTIGITIPLGSALEPRKINGILASVVGTEHQDVVNQIVLRAQSQAIYATDNNGHFGLNLARYAHFTSPIRRYADLTVHRALINAAGLSDSPIPYPDDKTLGSIAENISVSERRASAAERDTVDRLIAYHLADRVGATLDGVISGVSRGGVFVRLGDLGTDGFVPVSTLGNEYFHHDEAAMAFIGADSGLGFRLSDKVEVRIKSVEPLTGSVELEMVSEGQDLGLQTTSFHKSTRKHAGRPRFGKTSGARSGGKGPSGPKRTAKRAGRSR